MAAGSEKALFTLRFARKRPLISYQILLNFGTELLMELEVCRLMSIVSGQGIVPTAHPGCNAFPNQPLSAIDPAPEDMQTAVVC